MTLFVSLQGAERSFPESHPGYTVVALSATTVRGYDAVSWEFEFEADGGRKHVKSIYWRAAGVDYVLYASAMLTSWAEMQTIYNTAFAATKP
jgi:hypothetical protein